MACFCGDLKYSLGIEYTFPLIKSKLLDQMQADLTFYDNGDRIIRLNAGMSKRFL